MIFAQTDVRFVHLLCLCRELGRVRHILERRFESFSMRRCRRSHFNNDDAHLLGSTWYIFRRRNWYFIFHFTFRCIFTFYNLAAVVCFRIFYKSHFVHFQMSTRHFPTVKWALSEAKTWRNITISMRRSAGEWKAGEQEVDVDLFAVLHGANSNWWISDYDFYRGKFGTVFKCKEKSSRQLLAAKFIAVPNRKERKNVEREIDMMNRLQHPKIIQLYDAFEYNKMVCVVLELWVRFFLPRWEFVQLLLELFFNLKFFLIQFSFSHFFFILRNSIMKKHKKSPSAESRVANFLTEY